MTLLTRRNFLIGAPAIVAVSSLMPISAKHLILPFANGGPLTGISIRPTVFACGDIVVFNRLVTPEERANIEIWLRQKWSL